MGSTGKDMTVLLMEMRSMTMEDTPTISIVREPMMSVTTSSATTPSMAMVLMGLLVVMALEGSSSPQAVITKPLTISCLGITAESTSITRMAGPITRSLTILFIKTHNGVLLSVHE